MVDKINFYQDIEILKLNLVENGNTEVSALLNEGMSGLNGLTDGWAYLLEHLLEVKTHHRSGLANRDAEFIDQLYEHVYKIVTRN